IRKDLMQELQKHSLEGVYVATRENTVGGFEEKYTKIIEKNNPDKIIVLDDNGAQKEFKVEHFIDYRHEIIKIIGALQEYKDLLINAK
ncbi:MAG TPA: hypothetical protein VKR58_05355, partial [Aquella sp.]|nr:hypothetical protein [Aquella sp.]